MPALEFMVPLYSMTAILIAMTLVYIIVWWMHRRLPMITLADIREYIFTWRARWILYYLRRH